MAMERKLQGVEGVDIWMPQNPSPVMELPGFGSPPVHDVISGLKVCALGLGKLGEAL